MTYKYIRKFALGLSVLLVVTIANAYPAEPTKQPAKSATDTLKGKGFQNPGVVILNWQPFEPPRQDDGGRETVDSDTPSTMVLRLVA